MPRHWCQRILDQVYWVAPNVALYQLRFSRDYRVIETVMVRVKRVHKNCVVFICVEHVLYIDCSSKQGALMPMPFSCCTWGCFATLVKKVPVFWSLQAMQSKCLFGAAGAVPSAWAVGSSKPPRSTSGTVNFHWWTGGRNDYKRAISEVEPLTQWCLIPITFSTCEGRRLTMIYGVI